MNRVLEPMLGPLAAIECRRALSRRWVLVVRTLAAVPPALVLLSVLWLWWFEQQLTGASSPAGALVAGTALVEGMLVTVTLLLGPALLAGALAGEQVRSTLALLLATSATAAEIVLARLAGRLCVVGVVVAAGLPFLVCFAALCGLPLLALATLAALPAIVGFGAGGLALAVSVWARRGRDALLAVYLFEILLLLSPLFLGGLSANVRQWLEPLNPYHGISALAEAQDFVPALQTMAFWTLLGAAGCIAATRRLRAACLSETDSRRRRWRFFQSARLPGIGDRPMLWKELYIEQGLGSSRIVLWIGIVVVAIFAGVSMVLAGMVAWASWVAPDVDLAYWAQSQLTAWLAWSRPMAWLVQWALGLRAAAAIAAERQHNTWDGLLVSPLEGREIVLGKICGSIYALRGFCAALALAWAAGALCGATTVGTFLELLAQTLIIGAFMVAIGTAFSLSSASATRAMTFTIVGWLAAACITAMLAGIFTLIAVFAWMFWSLLNQGLLQRGIAVRGPSVWPGFLFLGSQLALYGLAALLVAVYIQRRFDVLAGRCSTSQRR